MESGFTSGGDTVYSVVPNNVIQTRETPFSKQFEDNLGKSVGFTLSVPIFNGWAARNNVTRARIGLEQARISREQTRKRSYKSVQQAVTDAQQLRRGMNPATAACRHSNVPSRKTGNASR